MNPAWVGVGFGILVTVVGFIAYFGRVLQRIDHLESEMKALKEKRPQPKVR